MAEDLAVDQIHKKVKISQIIIQKLTTTYSLFIHQFFLEYLRYAVHCYSIVRDELVNKVNQKNISLS